MLLASSALATLALSAADLGGGGTLAAVELQSYDPSGPNYVSPEIFAMLPAEKQALVVTVAPISQAEIDAGIHASATIQGFLPNRSGSLEERLSAVEDALSTLTTIPAPAYGGPVGGETLSSADRLLLSWAERVLNKWHSNEKPDATGAPISGE